jgi:methionyl-tRNA formyltransferase
MRIAFFGTPGFAVPSLNKLYNAGFDICCVITAKEKPKGRGLKILPSPVKTKAQELGIEVLEPEDPNTREFYESLSSKNIDVGVLAAYGYILKPLLLNLPKKGFINLHPSLLPRYRGAAPINWVIMRGEKETGLTTFLMNEKIDAGKIIQQKSLEIKAEETAGELTQRLAELGAELMVETLQLMEKDNFPTLQQKDREVILAPKIKDKDRIIDWTKTNLEIHNRIRGLSPMPTAYTNFRDKRVEIYRSSCLVHNANVVKPTDLVPGAIVIPNKDLIAATGNGLINITQLKIEGGKMITGRDFINGQRIKPGEKFYHK